MARLDLRSETGERKIMNTIREEVSHYIFDCMKSRYGDNYVRYIDKEIAVTDNAQKVAKNTVVADVADVIDYGKCEVGAVCEVIVKVKKWNSVEKKNGKTQWGVCLDDYDVGEE